MINNEPEIILERPNIQCIEIAGDSMAPTLKNGARIAVVQIEDKDLIHPGNIYYVLDRNYQGVVKRLYHGKDENHIELRSDNPDKGIYPSYELPLSKIASIFKVKAVFTRR